VTSGRGPRTIEVNLDVIECEVCGRSLLRGEHPKVFVDAEMMRRTVCDLCPERAVHGGWLPEDAQRVAAVDRDGSRRGLLGRFRRRTGEPEPAAEPVWSPDEPSVVDRALEIFNASHFPRVVAGIAQSLGRPLVSVLPCPKRGDVVSIVVGWRLAWLRYEVDPDAGVQLVAQGEQLTELPPYERLSNAAADEDGCLHGEALAA